MARPGHAQRAVLLAVLLQATACLYDADQRCGPAMTYDAASDACRCAAGAIQVEGGCHACAADEVVSGTTCVCPVGHARGEDGHCAPVVGLGDPCSAAAPCTDATYSLCAVAAGASAGVCARPCPAGSGCDAGDTCAVWAPEPYCRRFVGAGTPCTSQAECTGDAMYCDTFVSHTCLVAGCSLASQDCPSGLRCCDFTAYALPNLCVVGCPP